MHALIMERGRRAGGKGGFLLGFRKIGTDRWEFANEDFLRGKRARLKHINRRRSSHVQVGTQVSSSIGMGGHGAESELQKLRREKELMMQEVAQLRQENLLTVRKMDDLNQRMESAEARQKHMVSFLAKVLQNPVFVGHLKQLKEQRRIASTRVRRKFLSQQQRVVSRDVSDRPVDHQIVRYISDSASGSLMPDSGSGETVELPEHLLRDVLDKLGLGAGEPEPLQASNESRDLEGKTRLSSQMDACFSAGDYFVSLPDDVTPDEMGIDDITPAGLVVSKADSATIPFRGKEIINLETEDTTDDTAVGVSSYLKTSTEDISQERMFPDVVNPADDCVGEEGIWDLSLEAGGSLSSCPAIWDCISHYDAQEMEVVAAEAGSCSFWDLGLHNLDEDFNIDKYVSGESSFQENKDEGGRQNKDCHRDLEP